MREKVRTALRRKAVRGEVLGRPPYGYKVGPRNRLEVVDDEAVVVRYIFRLYLHEGLGIRLISRRLNEEGLRTRRNRPWSMVSIRDILRNRAYLGTYQRLGVRVPGTHTALVSPDDFRKVQERLSDRRTNYSPRTVTGFLLSGMVYCASCDNRMIGVSRRQSWTRRRDGSEQVASYRYYQCESRTNQGICSYNTQRSEELEGTVRAKLSEIDPRHLATAGNDEAVIEQWQAESRRLRERLHQIDRRLNRELEAAAADGTGSDRLRSHGHALAEERLKVEEELRDAEWRAEHYASAAERRRTRNAALDLLVGEWETLPMEDKQQLLRELIDQVRVGEEGVELVLRP
jgi:site-specific DNA recombinase